MTSFLVAEYVTSTFPNDLNSIAKLKDDFMNENVDVASL